MDGLLSITVSGLLPYLPRHLLRVLARQDDLGLQFEQLHHGSLAYPHTVEAAPRAEKSILRALLPCGRGLSAEIEFTISAKNELIRFIVQLYS